LLANYRCGIPTRMLQPGAGYGQVAGEVAQPSPALRSSFPGRILAGRGFTPDRLSIVVNVALRSFTSLAFAKTE